MANSITVSGPKSPRSPDAGEFVLPQWILEILRSCVGVLCRLLWRVKHIDVENIPHTGGLIVASNHQSYLDPFLISLPIKRRTRYLAWDVALGWPIVGRLVRLLGAWPLQLEGSDPSAIRRSLKWLRQGEALVIFPEGGRGRPDGSMVRFKAGAVRIALEAGVPILPVTIRGANRVWPIGRRIPGLGRVEIVYHTVLHPEPKNGEDARACARRETEQLAEVIRSAL